MTRGSRLNQVWGAITAHAAARGVPVSLHVLCETAIARLPVTGVAVAIPGGFVASELICVTDPLSRRLEELQLTLGEGPTLEALAARRSILVEDLDAPEYHKRWPLFAPQAIDAGARAIFVLPLRVGAVRGGVFALYVEHSGWLLAEDLAEAWVFAQFAVELVLNERSRIIPKTVIPSPLGISRPRPRFTRLPA